MNLAEWIRATVVVGPADEPMLRRAELLEQLANSMLRRNELARKSPLEQGDTGEYKRLCAEQEHALAALAKEE